MKSRALISLIAAGLALLVATPALAAYFVAIDVIESNGTSYSMLAMNVSMDIDHLADNGFIDADGLDVRISDSQGSNRPFMLATDRAMLCSAIPGSKSTSFRLTTDNTPLASFDIVTGYGGYITTSDAAALELGNDFAIEFDGWLDTTVTVYPTVAATATSQDEGGTSHTVDLPSNIESGDLLLVFFGAYDTSGSHSCSFPDGWTEIINEDDSYTVFAVGYRIADGGESSTISVTVGDSMSSAHNAYRITGYQGTPEAASSGSAVTSSTPDPPNLTTSWGTGSKTLWFAGFGGGYDLKRTLTSPPANYGNELFVAQSGGDARSGHTGSARRQLMAASEDPGVFTLSASIRWHSATVAVRGQGDAIMDKPGAINIIMDASGELDANIFGGSPRTVTASGLTAGAYSIEVWADGSDFGIDIDESTEDTVALAGASVPDNANDWILWPVYLNYYKHSVSDTLIAWYEPIDIIAGTALPDREGAAQDGAITWGSNPGGISITTSELQLDEIFQFEQIAPETQDIIKPEPGALTSPLDLERLESNPFHPLVQTIVTTSNLTETFVWTAGGFLWLAVPLIFVFFLSRENITLTATVGLGISSFLYLAGIFQLWVVILFVFGAVAAIVHEKMPTW